MRMQGVYVCTVYIRMCLNSMMTCCDDVMMTCGDHVWQYSYALAYKVFGPLPPTPAACPWDTRVASQGPPEVRACMDNAKYKQRHVHTLVY